MTTGQITTRPTMTKSAKRNPTKFSQSGFLVLLRMNSTDTAGEVTVADL